VVAGNVAATANDLFNQSLRLDIFVKGKVFTNLTISK
jgi:hypothetical protein